MSYRVKEMFYTLQGEGTWTGTPAVFVRFTGCNVWSGKEEDRERDAAKGLCARWCDTDFVGMNHDLGGGVYETAAALADAARALGGAPIVVLTGGEPSLQVDEVLVSKLINVGFRVHVETNGSRVLPPGVSWVTLSPKPPMPVVDQKYDEVKTVLCDGLDPEEWRRAAPVLFLQPLAGSDEQRAIEYVLAHPWWRLSLQTHKLLQLP